MRSFDWRSGIKKLNFVKVGLKAAWIFMLLFYMHTSVAQSVGYDIYLTGSEVNNQPGDERQTEFDCTDRIFVVVIAAGLSLEKHELKVRWLDPSGAQKELTRYNFDGLSVTKIWAWLQLNGPTGAMIGQMFDPSFGMEEFIGGWNAEVYIDNQKVSQQPFRVLC